MTMNANPLVDMCELILRTRFADLPPRAVERAKTFILDTLGVGLAGSTAPRIAELIATVRSWGGGDEARVWSHGTRLPALSAAVTATSLLQPASSDDGRTADEPET